MEFVPSHCPYCGSELGMKREEGRERLYCSSCDRIIWRNAEPVAGVAVKKGEEVLLVKRGIEPGKGKWSLPAGFLELEETAEEAAVRELEEETDLSAEKGDLEFLDTLNIERFPEQRLLAVVFLLDAEEAEGEVSPGSDAVDAGFWNLEDFEDSEEELRSHFLPALEGLLDN
ncbi:MAG: NUDIX domain-containing protein [Candidatus Nanosalina sp.]